MNSDFVGIGEAAQILGLSRTSLQKLVDSGQLAAVKTTGGHRRIARASLDALNAKMGLGAVKQSVAARAAPARAGSGRFSVLIAEDDEVTIAQLEGLIQKEFPQIDCQVARDGLDAVLHLERMRPNVLVTDLGMEPFDGFRLMHLIRGKPEYADIALLVVSSMSAKEIDKRGGLPPGVVFHRKPVVAQRLYGYLEAHLQMHQRGGPATSA